MKGAGSSDLCSSDLAKTPNPLYALTIIIVKYNQQFIKRNINMRKKQTTGSYELIVRFFYIHK